MDRFFTSFATRMSGWVGQPAAFVIALLSIILWGATGPVFGFSDTWQLIVNTTTTIITFLMVFLIQNAQNRDAAAIQAKLDEVIRATDGARNRFIGIEHLSETQIEAIRKALEEDCAKDDGDTVRHDTVSRMLRRL
jgi:low affinity Fe/Cu permease